MKRSGRFITVLLCLFMFQSLWNVAAAFCGHEKQLNQSSSVVIQHFGHHMAMNCHQDDQTSLNLNNNLKDKHLSSSIYNLSENLQNDHSDHLPSFSHFIVGEKHQQADEPILSDDLNAQLLDWKNFYQSPDLYLKNPPPVLTPLLVG